MTKSYETKKAVHRIIDSVWTVEYIQISESAVCILKYDRKDSEGYEREKELDHGRVVEDDNRTVKGLKISDPLKSSWDEPENTRLLNVVNPQHVFSYTETPVLDQLLAEFAPSEKEV